MDGYSCSSAARLLRLASVACRFDHQDLPVDGSPVVEIADRMPPDVEVRVDERANANVFRTGYAPLANRPSTWLAS